MALAVCRVLDDDRFAMALADRLQQEARQRATPGPPMMAISKAVQMILRMDLALPACPTDG